MSVIDWESWLAIKKYHGDAATPNLEVAFELEDAFEPLAAAVAASATAVVDVGSAPTRGKSRNSAGVPAIDACHLTTSPHWTTNREPAAAADAPSNIAIILQDALHAEAPPDQHVTAVNSTSLDHLVSADRAAVVAALDSKLAQGGAITRASSGIISSASAVGSATQPANGNAQKVALALESRGAARAAFSGHANRAPASSHGTPQAVDAMHSARFASDTCTAPQSLPVANTAHADASDDDANMSERPRRGCRTAAEARQRTGVHAGSALSILTFLHLKQCTP